MVAVVQRPRLDRLVEQALLHNRDLATAQAHVQSMLAGITQADAERWPSTQASLGATYGKSADDQTLAKATDSHAPSQWQFNPGFELAYQVDIWGQVQHSIERARVQAAAAQDAEDLLRVTVAAQTTRAYVNACALGARAKVQRDSLDVVAQSLALIDRQRRAGLVTDLEYTRMQVLQGETLALLPMLEARRQVALYELAMLTGVTDLKQDPRPRPVKPYRSSMPSCRWGMAGGCWRVARIFAKPSGYCRRPRCRWISFRRICTRR